MADNIFYYRGFPLLRQGNTIIYGCGGDPYAAKLTIKDTKKVADEDVPNTVMVQLLPNTSVGGDMNKARKGDFTGFYEALDTAHIWLSEALFN